MDDVEFHKVNVKRLYFYLFNLKKLNIGNIITVNTSAKGFGRPLKCQMINKLNDHDHDQK